MPPEYLVNTRPELVEDVLSCVTADGGPEIAESVRDGLPRHQVAESAWGVLRPIQTVSSASSRYGEYLEQI